MSPPQTSVRRRPALERRSASPTAITLVVVGGATLGAWLWSRATQPGIDAATLARLRPRPLRQGL